MSYLRPKKLQLLRDLDRAGGYMPFDEVKKKDQRIVLGAFKTGDIDIQLSRNRIVLTQEGEANLAAYRKIGYDRSNPEAPLSVVFRDEGRRRKVYERLNR